MTKPTELIKRTFIGIMVCLQVVFYPAAALAENEPAPDTSSSEQVSQPDAEPLPPPSSTGSETTESGDTASTTTVNTEDTAKATPAPYVQTADGSWSNGTYTWDPETKQSSPDTPQEYSYNPETKMWDTVEYAYDPATGKYVPNVKSVAQVPSSGSPVSLLSSPAASTGLSLGGATATGPNSTNALGLGSSTDGFFSGFFNARISNTVNSSAHSGNASVIQNTSGGNALTGDAAVILNLLNLLHSSWDPSFGDINTFIANIDGDVNGDIMIDPAVVSATGPGSLNTIDSQSSNNLTVVAEANGSINNDVNVDASSGKATVSGNTTGGDARTGNVSAIVNLLNLINSYITSGNSFFGVLNINGNLNGDILLAPWLLEGLIANTGPGSTNSTSQTASTNLNASVSDTSTIENNVDANATSGSANVSGNTTAGSGTSGDASTNITILNLTGRQVIAKNALLVFVNVFGKWVGLIMDAPAGTNSALLSDTGPGSSNTATSTQSNNADINLASNNSITNNVSVNAASGDASVTGNTIGGDAETGDAHAGVNIGNIINSQFNLSDWFGVLFINVFGSWTGSFGVNTAAGDPPVVAQTAVSSEQQSGSAPGAGATGSLPGSSRSNGVFGFLPRLASTASGTGYGEENAASDQEVTAEQAVAGDNGEVQSFNTQSSGGNSPSSPITSRSNWVVISIGMASGLLLLGSEKIATLLRRRTRGVF